MLIVAVHAAIYLAAILVAEAALVVSLAIYAAVPGLYFLVIAVDRSTAPPGSEEDEAFT